MGKGIWLYGVFLAAICAVGGLSGKEFSPSDPGMKAASQPASPPDTRFRGVVVDALTGRPVEGVKVGYIRYIRPRMRQVDYDNGMITDSEGQFTFYQIGYGLVVSHEKYWSLSVEYIHMRLDEGRLPGEMLVKVRLSAGADIVGTVSDADGKPVAGALVSSWEKKSASTDSQGRFIVYSPRVDRDGKTYLYVTADGFVPLFIKSLLPAEMTNPLVLERHYEVVISAQTPEGEPVKDFTAGVELPQSYSSDLAAQAVKTEPGHIRMIFHAPGKRLLWARTNGFAMAEVQIDVARHTSPVVVTFCKGVTVAGKAIVAEGGCRDGEAVMRRRSGDLVIPQIKTPLKNNGSYLFEHVGPGEYDLTIKVPGMTDAKTTVAVTNTSVDVPPVQVRGTGTVVGQVFHYEGGHPWSDVGGVIWAEDGKSFKFQTDDDGRFRVEGVTLGKARVSAGRLYGCIYHTVEAEVEVVEGKAQEVKLRPPQVSDDTQGP